ncbi:MAG: hypothetical protein ABL982_10915 [Vicinamibacterales bacterium]
MAMLPVALLPEVPAGEPPLPPVEPVEPAPEVERAPEVESALGVELMRALVSMKLPLSIDRDALDVDPVVPLVPVAPGVLPLP